jgi:hypothetical protein
MKRFADNKMERSFEVRDRVYLKLQPYRHITIAGTPHSKLSAKHYGLFEVLEKLGIVAYHLKLPPNSQIHLTFHVSQLKPRMGKGIAIEPSLPLMGPERGLRLVPKEILARKIAKRKMNQWCWF